MRFAILATALLGTVAVTACTMDTKPVGNEPAPAAAASAAAGKADFVQFCVACHGDRGLGNGPAAKGLKPQPANLTLLARNHGGTYPRLQVMSRIDGYTMGKSDSPMPAFRDLLDGPTVMFDAGEGLPAVATPARLVALQRYIETLQK